LVEGESKFDWDSAKAVANERKHGITFVGATAVFDDPNVVEEDATRIEHGERRVKAIGRVGRVVLAVIYTDRQGRRQIISARRASRHEREQCRQSAETI
jgi:uncharacterized DUF497 family protein